MEAITEQISNQKIEYVQFNLLTHGEEFWRIIDSLIPCKEYVKGTERNWHDLCIRCDVLPPCEQVELSKRRLVQQKELLAKTEERLKTADGSWVQSCERTIAMCKESISFEEEYQRIVFAGLDIGRRVRILKGKYKDKMGRVQAVASGTLHSSANVQYWIKPDGANEQIRLEDTEFEDWKQLSARVGSTVEESSNEPSVAPHRRSEEIGLEVGDFVTLVTEYPRVIYEVIKPKKGGHVTVEKTEGKTVIRKRVPLWQITKADKILKEQRKEVLERLKKGYRYWDAESKKFGIFAHPLNGEMAEMISDDPNGNFFTACPTQLRQANLCENLRVKRKRDSQIGTIDRWREKTGDWWVEWDNGCGLGVRDGDLSPAIEVGDEYVTLDDKTCTVTKITSGKSPYYITWEDGTQQQVGARYFGLLTFVPHGDIELECGTGGMPTLEIQDPSECDSSNAIEDLVIYRQLIEMGISQEQAVVFVQNALEQK
jgi:hypothetical protein